MDDLTLNEIIEEIDFLAKSMKWLDEILLQELSERSHAGNIHTDNYEMAGALITQLDGVRDRLASCHRRLREIHRELGIDIQQQHGAMMDNGQFPTTH